MTFFIVPETGNIGEGEKRYYDRRQYTLVSQSIS